MCMYLVCQVCHPPPCHTPLVGAGIIDRNDASPNEISMVLSQLLVIIPVGIMGHFMQLLLKHRALDTVKHPREVHGEPNDS